ncbi:MAG: hypothetical protein EAX89_16915 [Candidatus Lokiarchaeota archaeon]|nr:hypothetical protein [Candidatus Lokiarchaeota archaeon]
MVKEQKGISLADLAGSLVEVRIIQPQFSEKRGSAFLTILCEYDGKEVQFGIVGQSKIDSILENHGRVEIQNVKGEEVKTMFLKVPEKVLKLTDDGKIQWINFDY